MYNEFAIVFKRKLIEEKNKKETTNKNSKTDNEYDKIILEVEKLVFGNEKKVDGKRVFVTNFNETIPYADDIDSLNKKTVYGYPFKIENYIKLSLYENFDECDFPQVTIKDNDATIYIEADDDVTEDAIKFSFVDYFACRQLYDYEQTINKGENKLETFSTRKFSETNRIYLDAVEKDFLERELEIYTDDYEEYLENDNSKKTDVKVIGKIDVKNTISKVVENVIGQDDAVRAVVSSIDVNLHVTDRRIKRNILLVGPTGVGKTEIFRNISKTLNLPMVTEDANQFTSEGYVGRSVDEMIHDLIDAANGDIKKAERGILFIDEIDKKACTNSSENIATEAVLNSLLKYLDGDIVNITSRRGNLQFNTMNLTIACAGAFSGLDKITSKKSIGFNPKEINESTLYDTEAFNRYGFKPEFMGRLNIKKFLNSLSIEDLIKILLSKNGPIELNKKLFDNYNTKLKFNDNVIEVIAKRAFDQKTGARSLNDTINNLLEIALLNVQSDENIKSITITNDTINDPKKYVLTR